MSEINQSSKEIELSDQNEWYSRGHLPHRNKIGLMQSITFRLADSLPSSLLSRLEYDFDLIPQDKHDYERRIGIGQVRVLQVVYLSIECLLDIHFFPSWGSGFPGRKFPLPLSFHSIGAVAAMAILP
jgi:hypothetical protein